MGEIDLGRIEGEFLQTFLRDGGVPPISIIVAGGRIVDSLPVLGDRALFTEIVRRRCRETGADTVVVYAEAWGAVDSPDSPRPSMRPDRRELLMAYTENDSGSSVRAWPIIRNCGRVLLGDVQTMGTAAGGGFDNLLGR